MKFAEFLVRLGCRVLPKTLYRLRVTGAANVPVEGGALLVVSRACCVDAVVVAASLGRRVRFMAPESLFAAPGFGFLRERLGLDVHEAGDRAEAGTSSAYLAAARAALEAGEVIGVFAEGLTTPAGENLPLRDILAGILDGIDVPVIPVFVDGLHGQIFNVTDGRLVWRWPPRIGYPIAVSFGARLGPDVTAHAVVAGAQEAGTHAYSERLWEDTLLHRAFFRAARRHLTRMAVVDARTPALSFFKTLVGSIIFARKLKPLLEGQQVVGVLLPPSVGGALTNVALQIMGKAPVNLNYTASAETMAEAARQAGLTHVITAHAFLERMPLEVPGTAVYLEDVRGTITKLDRFAGMAAALLAPVWWVERWVGSPAGRSDRDLATIIFSSGSEGVPKGVMLSQYNVMSNIDSVVKFIPYKQDDRLVGILPFFHSFGFAVTLWLPLVASLGVIYHPNPLEARNVGKLIKRHQGTFLIATSTFLQNFIRRCPPEDLRGLRWVVCGAEKLTERVRAAFIEKFRMEPLEGYGVTECSPVVSVNIHDVDVPGFRCTKKKRGTIGRPLPGIAARVVDPDSGAPLPPDAPGLLLIKGPNVMQGYLDMPERTAEVMRDGWYATGDIAAIDEDGFITITDRLARFSKIAGEMVPHIRIEESMHELLGLTDQALAVAAVPDSSKGERLIVLHTLEDDQLDTLLAKLDESDLPNLWRPRPNAFYRIDAIPVLGTGKMDIKSVKRTAQELDLGE